MLHRKSKTSGNKAIAQKTTIAGLRPEWIGVILFGISAPVHLFLAKDASVAVSAVTLALIGGAYIGFGAADGRHRVFLSELGVAILFGTAGVLGLLWHWAALPLGLALHAGWDLLHHVVQGLARVPRWYIPLCIVFDLLAAAFLFLLYGVWMP